MNIRMPEFADFQLLSISDGKFRALIAERAAKATQDFLGDDGRLVLNDFSSIQKLASLLCEAVDVSFESTLDSKARNAYLWLMDNFSFRSGAKSLSLDMNFKGKPSLESFTNRIAISKEWAEKHNERNPDKPRKAQPIVNEMTLIKGRLIGMDVLCGVSEAMYGYLSGKRLKAAQEGIETFKKLDHLLSEIEEIVNKEWMPFSIRNRLAGSPRSRKTLREAIAEEREIMLPHSIRNDSNLSARLYIAELSRLNIAVFGNARKIALFHFAGILDISLDMKTIERVSANELARAKRNPFIYYSVNIGFHSSFKPIPLC